MAGVIPAVDAERAQEALLVALHGMLEAAMERASAATALDEVEDVAGLCLDGAYVAGVVALLGRRAAPRPP